MRKAVIIAPFWGQPGHVGNYRVERFVRWLSDEHVEIVLIRAGASTCRRVMPWGIELTVRDPLGVYRDKAPTGASVKRRKSSRMRQLLVRWLFNPDPGIIWAQFAARHRLVAKNAVGAIFVLSSSPPESAHIAAASIARKLATKLVVDMRDGWLDEPLKPLLRASRFQRWREGRLEKSVLEGADRVFVTSPVWKALLENRRPIVRGKTTVLFNAYPPNERSPIKRTGGSRSNGPIKLLHAGRFTGSSLSRVASKLLEPLLPGIAGAGAVGVVTLLGTLEARDLEEIARWEQRFLSEGWTIEIKDAIPRDEMMTLLGQADGLLLLSASYAAIPSKLFEYIPIAKPIFATTPQGSAVSRIGVLTGQIFLSDYRQPDPVVARSFISACQEPKHSYSSPDEFSEEFLSKIFLREVLAD